MEKKTQYLQGLFLHLKKPQTNRRPPSKRYAYQIMFLAPFDLKKKTNLTRKAYWLKNLDYLEKNIVYTGLFYK